MRADNRFADVQHLVACAGASIGLSAMAGDIDLSAANGLARSMSATPRDHIAAMPTPHGPAMGLADHGGQFATLDLSGIGTDSEPIMNRGGATGGRFLSTFVIWPAGAEPEVPGGPRRAIAAAVFDTTAPVVSLGSDVVSFTATAETEGVFWSAVGTIEEVYAAWKHARNQMGYPGTLPRAEWFELGWESRGSLGENTGGESTQEHISIWDDLGFGIRWAITDASYWADGHTTTSFGFWNEERFPDVPAMRAWLQEQDISWILGGRTNFIGGVAEPDYALPADQRWTKPWIKGPFFDEGKASGYFVSESNGKVTETTSSVFPRVPFAVLDGRSGNASRWFADRWGEWAVDGIQEDTMAEVTDAGVFNGPMHTLAQRGQLVMARNAAFTSPGTLMRIEDIGGGVGFQQVAASGSPNVHAGAVGRDGTMEASPRRAVRQAWFSSFTPGMALGALPVDWSTSELDALRAAVGFHHAIGPTLYDAAMDSFETGYPWTMTPLPIAFPGDARLTSLSGMENSPLDYQWLIGGSLMAAPLSPSGLATAGSRNVYLPDGRWFEVSTGEVFEGPVMLEDHAAPIDEPPAFVGGHGILLVRDAEDRLICVAYPTIAEGESMPVTFTLPDGKSVTISRAVIRSRNGAAWIRPVVTDGLSGERVAQTAPSFPSAMSFLVEPGRRYVIDDDGINLEFIEAD